MLTLNLPAYSAKVTEKDGKRLIFDTVRRKYVALTPEEWVRQHFVHYLIDCKKYPSQLVGNEVNIKLNNTSKRCDSIVYNNFLEPLMVIEYKAPSVQISSAVFDQIVRYNMTLKVRYLVVTNGLQHFCCKIDYTTMQYDFLEEVPVYSELI